MTVALHPHIESHIRRTSADLFDERRLEHPDAPLGRHDLAVLLHLAERPVHLVPRPHLELLVRLAILPLVELERDRLQDLARLPRLALQQVPDKGEPPRILRRARYVSAARSAEA